VRENNIEGTRQIDSRTSGDGMPFFKKIGVIRKRGATV